jgi:hypothetical protein
MALGNTEYALFHPSSFRQGLATSRTYGKFTVARIILPLHDGGVTLVILKENAIGKE